METGRHQEGGFKAPGEEVLQVTSPYFCAGLYLRNGVVVQAAPIVRYMNGWNRSRVVGFCRRKGWIVR